jgi:hypothetical protein
LIARHYALSDNRAKAVERLLQAAADAERLPSFRSALELCGQAWDLGEAALRERDGGDPRFRRWVMEATLGYARLTVLYGSSADPQAERAARRSRELALELGDRTAAATVFTMHGMLLAADPERFAESITLTEQAIEETRQVGTALQVISASRGLVWNYMVDGRFADAQAQVDALLAELERHGQRATPSDLYLATRMMRDSVRFYHDDLDGALLGATETNTLAVEFPNRTVQSASANTLAQVHLLRANYGEARLWAERSLTTSEATGNAPGVHRALGLLVVARGGLGESLAFARHADVIEHGVAQGGNLILQIYGVIETLLAAGEVGWAEKLARLAVERAAGRLRVLCATLALAAVAVQRGPSQWAEAERTLARASGIAEQIGMRSGRALALIGRGRLAFARGQVDEARSAWRSAREICIGLGFTRYQQLCTELLAHSAITDGGRGAVAETRISA